jgi:hypothetical protein
MQHVGRWAGLIKLLWHEIALTPAQLAALLDGCEWRAPVARRRPAPAG